MLALVASILLGARPQGAQPFYIARCPLWKGVDYAHGKTPFKFDLDERTLSAAIDRVVAAMNARDMLVGTSPDRKIETASTAVVRRVDSIMAQMLPGGPSRLTRQWLIAEGVCEYVRSLSPL